MSSKLIRAGASRSFPTAAALQHLETIADGLIIVGADAGRALADVSDPARYHFIAIELGTECLAEHIGLEADAGNLRVVGFARFRLGDAEPTQLVELVHLPYTEPQASAAARAAFETLSFTVAACADFPGRIVDRLIRPYFNAVLRRLDENLASAADLDTTLRLGLGYPEGPLALLNRTGLAHHFDVTNTLYESLGNADFAPARRARVAKRRSMAS